eukprot:5096172-Amphidinium_carterae.1
MAGIKMNPDFLIQKRVASAPLLKHRRTQDTPMATTKAKMLCALRAVVKSDINLGELLSWLQLGTVSPKCGGQ